MGTTLTAVALVAGADGRDVLALANVGDSRAYVFSEGQLFQVTDDHSLAEERMRQGEMTEAEAAIHPQRHILTRALGVSAEVEADMWQLELHGGDRVLLCSDGLSNELGTEEMAEILRTVEDPEQAARRLVEAANEHGGADNITVVVVDVQVGEDHGGGPARVRPLGLGTTAAAAPATATVPAVGSAAATERADPTSAEEPSALARPVVKSAAAGGVVARVDDTLAPGSRLGFGDEHLTLAEEGPRSDEFFLGSATGAMPVARTTTRVAPAPAPQPGPERQPKESRGARRRRLGIPHRITPRVLGFILLVAAVPVAAYFVLRWFAYDNWIVTLQGDQVVVVQGQRGGVLWFHPKTVDRTGVTTSQILPTAVAPLRAGVQEGSLRAARTYVSALTTTTTTAPPLQRSNPAATTTTPTVKGAVTTTTAAPAVGTTTTTTVAGP
jgi:protein phosphatase